MIWEYNPKHDKQNYEEREPNKKDPRTASDFKGVKDPENRRKEGSEKVRWETYGVAFEERRLTIEEERETPVRK